MLLEVALELPLKPIRVQRHAFGPPRIGAIFQWAPVHHPCVLGDVIVSTVPRCFCGDGEHVRSLSNVQVVVTRDQIHMDWRQLFGHLTLFDEIA